MANTFRVVLDACVMLPQNLNNLLLTLAEHELFTPVWSPQLLDEVHRNLVDKIGLTAAQADRRVSALQQAFPHAGDHSSGYLKLVDAMTNDPKDRHVLAAAVASSAQLIVTANLRDFPAGACHTHGVEAVHPDEFLLDQLDLDPLRVIDAISHFLDRNQRPPQTVIELIEVLRPTTPRFGEALLEQLQPVNRHVVTDDPARWSDEDDALLEYEALPAWHPALFVDVFRAGLEQNAPTALLEVFVTPESRSFWGDFGRARAVFASGLRISMTALYGRDAPDVAYVRLVETTDHTTSDIAEVPATMYATLVWRPEIAVVPNSGWRMHQLGEAVEPSRVHRTNPGFDIRTQV